MTQYNALTFSVANKIATITMNRPKKANALNRTLWFELGEALDEADENDEVRVVVLRGEGKHFTSGIDYSLIAETVGAVASLPEGKKQSLMRRHILELQDAFSKAERCRKPVIAAIHGSCIGAGIDLISACDIRYASAQATFSIKEVDLAIVADIGTLQRVPAIIGEGYTRELALTARRFDATEADRIGLVNRVFDDRKSLDEHVLQVACEIASKSPLATRGTKQVLNYSRDHSVENGLNYVATWNSAMLLSADAQEAMGAMFEGRAPNFSD